MDINTRFGEISIEEKDIITFKKGIIGLEDLKKFILLEHPSKHPERPSVFKWLQSVEDGQKAFVVMDPWLINKDYSFEMGENIKQELELDEKSWPLVLAIAVIAREPKESTVNLRAPVVINTVRRLGKQIIIDSDGFPMRQKIFR